ncbi:T9SS C-terminal target domain-containing protein [Ornithobacterium rhinotracheale]|uniref:T9SS type A sorting domain-containing protein n=1 Tax=Ornithobacterium rhinotracheale TaxID=28251 RepID=UPI00129CA695|nr:T9SS type A sorting domain-containing protein [Ornithobacterium rhinotracheale]MRJ09822.1 T9SS C-terminal target domain-containing protein [Ornithobacterium rhinotracheale]
MKNPFKSVFYIFLLVGTTSIAQITTNEEPYSFTHNKKLYEKSKNTYSVINLQIPDLKKIYEEDANSQNNSGFERVAVPISVNFNSEHDGDWTETSEGGKLWTITFHAKNAKSIDFVFDKFWLPKGGKFFVYNPQTKEKIGAITADFLEGNRNEPKSFSTGIILGDIMTLEYFQPEDIKEKPIISISKIYYGYKKLKSAEKFGDSGNCNVNINCVEGQNWQKEKNAVARIYIKSPKEAGWCSGALINNSKEDSSPLFLTADHCINDYFDAIRNNDLSSSIFYWNYEFPSCENENIEPPILSTAGAIVKANNPNTDFALLELKQDPRNLPNAKLYYLGWDRTGNHTKGGVGIHHPRGDVKKISIDNDDLKTNKQTIHWTDGGISLPETHWVSTIDIGTSEGGSSGSPLLNFNHNIIGQLHGGDSRCAPVTKYYGRFDISWNGNNNPDSRRKLQPWLDPINSGKLTLEGKGVIPNYEIEGNYYLCSTSQYIVKNLAKEQTVNWSLNHSNVTISVKDNIATLSPKSYKFNNSFNLTAKVSDKGGKLIKTLQKEISLGGEIPDFELSRIDNYDMFNPSLNDSKEIILFASPLSSYSSGNFNFTTDYFWTLRESEGAWSEEKRYYNQSFIDIQPVFNIPSYSSGEYIVDLAINNACKRMARVFHFNLSLNNNPYRMYPIPASGYLNFELRNNPTNKTFRTALSFNRQNLDNKYTIILYNSSGKVVKRFTSNEIKSKFSLAGLQSGFYVAHIIINGRTYKENLIIK